MGSQPATSPPSAFEKKDGTGDGRSTALPYIDYQGQVWLQYVVPEEISVRRGTVAILALTSLQRRNPVPTLARKYGVETGGPASQRGRRKTARVPEGGPRGSRPPRVVPSLPRAPHAI